jgi:hypothetical protein
VPGSLLHAPDYGRIVSPRIIKSSDANFEFVQVCHLRGHTLWPSMVIGKVMALTEAIFGIVGVLVGGLLTGAVSYWQEREREIRSARAGARLVRHELAKNYQYMTFAQGRGSLAIIVDTPLSTERFDQQQSMIAARIPVAGWEALSKAYRGVDFVNNAARRHKDYPEAAAFDIQNLTSIISDLSGALGEINSYIKLSLPKT